MKKLISFLLALVMACAMTACSQADEPKDSKLTLETEQAETQQDVGQEADPDAEPDLEEPQDSVADALGELAEKVSGGTVDATDDSDSTTADSDITLDFSLDPYDREISTETAEIPDVDWDEIDISYTPGEIQDMEPIELEPMLIEIDPYTFDEEQFKEDTLGNIDEMDLDYFASLDVEAALKVAELQISLLGDLKMAFAESGLPVLVDDVTGEVTLDSAILFDVDSAEISEKGKAVLQRVAYVYANVLLNEKYQGFVSEILVEGHTDTSADYDYNLKLSQDRADSVKAFCLSEDCGLDEASRTELDGMMKTVGCSYDRPVYDEDGNVDMQASRRVSFRFLINLS